MGSKAQPPVVAMNTTPTAGELVEETPLSEAEVKVHQTSKQTSQREDNDGGDDADDALGDGLGLFSVEEAGKEEEEEEGGRVIQEERGFLQPEQNCKRKESDDVSFPSGNPPSVLESPCGDHSDRVDQNPRRGLGAGPQLSISEATSTEQETTGSRLAVCAGGEEVVAEEEVNVRESLLKSGASAPKDKSSRDPYTLGLGACEEDGKRDAIGEMPNEIHSSPPVASPSSQLLTGVTSDAAADTPPPDDLLMECFLAALRSKVTEIELPVSTSIFYQSHVLVQWCE